MKNLESLFTALTKTSLNNYVLWNIKFNRIEKDINKKQNCNIYVMDVIDLNFSDLNFEVLMY